MTDHRHAYEEAPLTPADFLAIAHDTLKQVAAMPGAWGVPIVVVDTPWRDVPPGAPAATFARTVHPAGPVDPWTESLYGRTSRAPLRLFVDAAYDSPHRPDRGVRLTVTVEDGHVPDVTAWWQSPWCTDTDGSVDAAYAVLVAAVGAVAGRFGQCARRSGPWWEVLALAREDAPADDGGAPVRAWEPGPVLFLPRPRTAR